MIGKTQWPKHDFAVMCEPNYCGFGGSGKPHWAACAGRTPIDTTCDRTKPTAVTVGPVRADCNSNDW